MFINFDNGSLVMIYRNLIFFSLNDIFDKLEKDQLKNKFMKKLLCDVEVFNVFVGEVDFLDIFFIVFVRLQQVVMLGVLIEVFVFIRFLFIFLGFKGKVKFYYEIGRVIVILMFDEVFYDIVYKVKDRYDLIVGIDEFLDEVIVFLFGEWDLVIRIEFFKSFLFFDKRKNMYLGGENVQMNGDIFYDGGYGGGGYGDCEELQ